ncbi:nucleoside triphosphate pyrophosphohydrolase family protein [Mucilaginibacter sp. PAMB04168]|uniref:nucleoside triphosphate pyrophosphohydrolase family protein n=1 Tax=Mucilaginibacter sp. PAMB04168 TaxID=3138567 RepID=UPI0031F6C97D
MQEASPLSQVAEFHRTFKHPILETPAIPSKSRCDLRVSLLAEEVKELQQAINDQNIVEIADALCDIQYVLAGAILEFGLGEKFKALFDEVHRSNMSKACETLEEAHKTIEHYRTSENCESYLQEEDSKFLVFRSVDNKTLKSINYSPANLKGLLL